MLLLNVSFQYIVTDAIHVSFGFECWTASTSDVNCQQQTHRTIWLKYI